MQVPGYSELIPVHKQIAVAKHQFIPQWQNNYGDPVLHFVPKGKGGIYYFASRFNPRWNDLPESSFFPEIMSELLWPSSPAKYDYRTLSPKQIMPESVRWKSPKVVSQASFTDLKYWCLTLATILFGIERLWVSRKGKVVL